MTPYKILMAASKQVYVPRNLPGGVVVPTPVRVDVPLYKKSIPGLNLLPVASRQQHIENILEEAEILTLEKFVLFLQIAAEYEPVFPMDYLRDFGAREYMLFVAPAYWTILRMQASMPGTGRILRAKYGDFEFEFMPHSRLHEDEAYLVSKERYQIYLHVQEQGDDARIFRSDFMDTAQDAPSPIALKARHILSELLHGHPTPSGILTDYDPDGLESADDLPPVCPQCAGRLVYLSPEQAFCRDCEWDNLKPIEEPWAFQ